MALAGGLAAPLSMPVAGPLSVPGRIEFDRRAGPVGDLIEASLTRPGADPELAAFYAARGERPLWVQGRRLRPETREVVFLVERAGEEDLDPADYHPGELAEAVHSAASGRPADLARAELALSAALGAYAEDLHRAKPAAQLLYSDPAFPPPDLDRRSTLELLAAARSLGAGLDALRRMNPHYEQFRAALAEEVARGGPNVDVIRANLERARALPVELGHRYILVDVTTQRLWAYEAGQPVFSMKVIVGKPSEPTPAMAAVVRYAVFRPYWNVPPDLVSANVAPKVLKYGMTYFRGEHLEALSDWTDGARVLDPTKVNWRAVALGRKELRVRQRPGPDNMMGRVKFIFPNELGVYLHDSPLRPLFAPDERLFSSGCIRLEDAPRLARWLLGEAALAAGQGPGPPETRTDLPEPTPVYILYLTAAPSAAGVALRKDVYGRDAALLAELGPAEPSASWLASW